MSRPSPRILPPPERIARRPFPVSPAALRIRGTPDRGRRGSTNGCASIPSRGRSGGRRVSSPMHHRRPRPTRGRDPLRRRPAMRAPRLPLLHARHSRAGDRLVLAEKHDVLARQCDRVGGSRFAETGGQHLFLPRARPLIVAARLQNLSSSIGSRVRRHGRARVAVGRLCPADARPAGLAGGARGAVEGGGGGEGCPIHASPPSPAGSPTTLPSAACSRSPRRRSPA